jgi:hypothetical protein
MITIYITMWDGGQMVMAFSCDQSCEGLDVIHDITMISYHNFMKPREKKKTFSQQWNHESNSINSWWTLG